MHITIRPVSTVSLASLLTFGSAVAQEPIDLKALLDDGAFGSDWIYDDIDAGFAAANDTGKPLLVAFR